MCSVGFSIQKSVHDSNLYYFKDKGSIKITSKLEALGRALLSGAIVEAPQVLMRCRKKIGQKKKKKKKKNLKKGISPN